MVVVVVCYGCESAVVSIAIVTDVTVVVAIKLGGGAVYQYFL